MQIPCECPLAGPINKDCPHHGASKKPDRPPKHKTMFTSEVDRVDWVTFAKVAFEESPVLVPALRIQDACTTADTFLEAIQARELR